ncbi:MAG: PadR family transcriptional regulator [Actinomycetota bacterium]|nr:PadR family transcriptional regulator [Actinomycetota bacterium]
MPPGKRSNPLALAVLVCLAERPMHPYEVAQTLRTRHKDDSVRLNYGSLYAVVEGLARRGLIEAAETERAGRLPERTIYRITDPGLEEMHAWLAELLAVPTKEYPAFEAALSFLPALSPGEARSLLAERIERLEVELASAAALRELVEKAHLPRLFWVEAEYATTLRQTELDFARRLAADIEAGTLDGLAWWRQVHDRPDGPVPPPPPWGPDDIPDQPDTPAADHDQEQR